MKRALLFVVLVLAFCVLTGARISSTIIDQIYVHPQQVAAVPAQPHACDATHLGQLIYVDDTNDTAESFLCFCGIDADDTTHIWLRADAPATNCF